VSDYLGSVMAILTVAASIIVATIPTRAASNDAQLLKDAQRVFKSLPREAIRLHQDVSAGLSGRTGRLDRGQLG
jgi:hypothetical protein